MKRSEIEMILEIEAEIDNFADSNFWMAPEEELRLRALGVIEKADIGDTISNILLRNNEYTEISLKSELRRLERLKKRLEQQKNLKSGVKS